MPKRSGNTSSALNTAKSAKNIFQSIRWKATTIRRGTKAEKLPKKTAKCSAKTVTDEKRANNRLALRGALQLSPSDFPLLFECSFRQLDNSRVGVALSSVDKQPLHRWIGRRRNRRGGKETNFAVRIVQ
jgi:hypothetical protein